MYQTTHHISPATMLLTLEKYNFPGILFTAGNNVTTRIYQITSDVILNVGFGYFVSMRLGFDYCVSIHMQVCNYDAHSSTLLNI